MRLVLVALFLVLGLSKAYPQLINVALSANDHKRKQPLAEALQHEFTGICADLSMGKDGVLKCGSQTLEELYLKPLRSRIQEHEGYVYNRPEEFFLVFRITSDSNSTIRKLDQVLSEYQDVISHTDEEGKWNRRAVRVFAGGNVPLYGGKYNFVHLDEPANKPVIRDNGVQLSTIEFKKLYSWKGEGTMPNMQYHSLISYIKNGKKNGRMVRIRNFPPTQLAFDLLLNAGADFLEIEELPAFRNYWRNRKPY